MILEWCLSLRALLARALVNGKAEIFMGREEEEAAQKGCAFYL